MTRGFERLVVDTYAWVELFAGTEKGRVARRYMLKAEELYTPDLVLAELARKYLREGIGEDVVRERLQLVERVSTIVSIDVETAVMVGRAYARLLENAERRGVRSKPSLADAIVLATAWRLKAKVLTGDKHFEGLEETVWLG